MKKVVLASLLACAAIASGLPSAYAQAPAVPAGAAAAPCALPDSEFKPYTDAMSQKDPKAMAAAIEAYLTAFPTSACPEYRLPTLVTLMAAYAGANDTANVLATADRVLKLDPNNLRALFYETYLRNSAAAAMTDATAKQAALDAAAEFAKRGLAATKGTDMDDATFKTLQGAAFPIFYSAIGTAALNKKDTPTAIDNFKKELASVPVPQTEVVPVLQDIYFLALAYLESTPPDYLNCAFYAARFVDYAPEPFKSQIDKTTGRPCFKQFHGGEDGYDLFLAAAKNSLAPPDGLFASIKPAPTPADIIAGVLASTPDLTTLNPDDRESIFTYGTPDQIAKVWDSIKGKSYTFPSELVVASTPTQVQVAISSSDVLSKTADYTFNLTPPDVPEEPEKPSSKATPAQLAAYHSKLAAYNKAVKAAQTQAAAIAAATAVGQSVTLEGTYDSYTTKPLTFVMSNASVELPKPEKPAAAPVHHAVPAHH